MMGCTGIVGDNKWKSTWNMKFKLGCCEGLWSSWVYGVDGNAGGILTAIRIGLYDDARGMILV